MTFSLLKSKGARQILGAAAGMLIATVLYVVMNDLPSMQVSKALLVEGNPTISPNADQVRVNDKTVDNDNLKRIAARAQQVAAQMDSENVTSNTASVSSASPASSVASVTESVPVVVQDHADRAAWLAMREAQRKQHAAFDVSVHMAASASSETTVATPAVSPVTVAVSPAVNDAQTTQTVTKTPLPHSGMGLNLIVLIAFILAVRAMSVERRRALIGM